MNKKSFLHAGRKIHKRMFAPVILPTALCFLKAIEMLETKNINDDDTDDLVNDVFGNSIDYKSYHDLYYSTIIDHRRRHISLTS